MPAKALSAPTEATEEAKLIPRGNSPKAPMKTLEETIEVYVGEDGNVCIAHVDMSEDCYVAIPPEQVDLLIDWLRKKQAEAVDFRRSPATPP